MERQGEEVRFLTLHYVFMRNKFSIPSMKYRGVSFHRQTSNIMFTIVFELSRNISECTYTINKENNQQCLESKLKITLLTIHTITLKATIIFESWYEAEKRALELTQAILKLTEAEILKLL